RGDQRRQPCHFSGLTVNTARCLVLQPPRRARGITRQRGDECSACHEPDSAIGIRIENESAFNLRTARPEASAARLAAQDQIAQLSIAQLAARGLEPDYEATSFSPAR